MRTKKEIMKSATTHYDVDRESVSDVFGYNNHLFLEAIIDIRDTLIEIKEYLKPQYVLSIDDQK